MMTAKGVARTLPFVASLPGRVGSMELASNDLWAALKRLSVAQLKALRPTPEYQPLIDGLIAVRELMGD